MLTSELMQTWMESECTYIRNAGTVNSARADSPHVESSLVKC